jgi:hypothetical protein
LAESTWRIASEASRLALGASRPTLHEEIARTGASLHLFQPSHLGVPFLGDLLHSLVVLTDAVAERCDLIQQGLQGTSTIFDSVIMCREQSSPNSPRTSWSDTQFTVTTSYTSRLGRTKSRRVPRTDTSLSSICCPSGDKRRIRLVSICLTVPSRLTVTRTLLRGLW